MDLQKCIPKSKNDFDAVKYAELVSFPEILPIVPELLCWVQDANWPVAPRIANLLVTGDSDIIPAVKQVFQSSDDIWKYWVISLIVAELPTKVIEEIRIELHALSSSDANDEDAEDLKSLAKTLLARTKL